MSLLNIRIHDHTGSSNSVGLPDDVPMSRLLPALITKMGFPLQHAGTPIIYRLDHERTGRRLQSNDTLHSIDAKEDDVFRLLPELTPGGSNKALQKETELNEQYQKLFSDIYQQRVL